MHYSVRLLDQFLYARNSPSHFNFVCTKRWKRMLLVHKIEIQQKLLCSLFCNLNLIGFICFVYGGFRTSYFLKHITRQFFDLKCFVCSCCFSFVLFYPHILLIFFFQIYINCISLSLKMIKTFTTP